MATKPLYKMTGKDLEMAAKSGKDPETLLVLSSMMARGWRGLDGDEDRALELEKQAAATGYARALCKLGDRYARGNVVDEDQAQAIMWWRRAAEAGSVDAMANLIALRTSDDPREAALGNHWLHVAASRGQPHAVHITNGGHAMQLSDLAKMSLEEFAATAPPLAAGELSWEVEDVRGTLSQVNDLVGLWVERLRPRFPDVRTVSTIDGDDVDFPGPDLDDVEACIAGDENSIELMLYAGPLHLQLDLSPSDETWTITASSYEPHPERPVQTWLVQQLVETMRDVKMRAG